MIITKLTINNLFSYDNFEINLDKNLNIIVGPNNSGKTNIVRTIQLVRDILNYSSRENYISLCHKDKNKGFRLEIDCDLNYEKKDISSFISCLKDRGSEVENKFYKNQWSNTFSFLGEKWNSEDEIAKRKDDQNTKAWLKGAISTEQEKVRNSHKEESDNIAKYWVDHFDDLETKVLSCISSMLCSGKIVISFNPPDNLSFDFTFNLKNTPFTLSRNSIGYGTSSTSRSLSSWILEFINHLASKEVGSFKKGIDAVKLSKKIQRKTNPENLLHFIADRGFIYFASFDSQVYNNLSVNKQFEIKEILTKYGIKTENSTDLGRFINSIFVSKLIFLTEIRERPLRRMEKEWVQSATALKSFLGGIAADTQKGLGFYLSWLKNDEDQRERNRFRTIQKSFKMLTGLDVDVSSSLTNERNKEMAETQIWITKNSKSIPLEFTGAGLLEILTILYFISGAKGQVILIDEPTLHLHPLFQEKIYKMIKDSTEQNQKIIITHSPYFVTSESLKNSHRFYLESGHTNKCSLDNALNNGVDKQILEDQHFKRSLFAAKVVLCEGQTEFLTIPVFMSKLGLNLDDHNIEIINIGGQNNFNKWLELYTALSIPTLVIGDKKVKREVNRKYHKNLYLFSHNDTSTFLACKFEATLKNKMPSAHRRWKQHPKHEISLSDCIDLANKVSSKEIKPVQGLSRLKNIILKRR